MKKDMEAPEWIIAALVDRNSNAKGKFRIIEGQIIEGQVFYFGITPSLSPGC
jgi:hypothetical protein